MKDTSKINLVFLLVIMILILFAIEGLVPIEFILLFSLILIIAMVKIKMDSVKIEVPSILEEPKKEQEEIEEPEKPVFEINETISTKLSRIGIVDKVRFIEKLQTIFKKYLISVNSKNIKLIYNLSSKELAESTIEMLNTYKKSGYRNKIENVEITDPEIISVSKFNGRNTVTLEIRVKLSDYLTDKDDKIVKGNSSRIKERRYQITYMEEDQKHKQNEMKCNNCGAIFDNKELKCPYCRTITNNNLKPREWYIVHKKIVENKNA